MNHSSWQASEAAGKPQVHTEGEEPMTRLRSLFCALALVALVGHAQSRQPAQGVSTRETRIGSTIQRHEGSHPLRAIFFPSRLCRTPHVSRLHVPRLASPLLSQQGAMPTAATSGLRPAGLVAFADARVGLHPIETALAADYCGRRVRRTIPSCIGQTERTQIVKTKIALASRVLMVAMAAVSSLFFRLPEDEEVGRTSG